MKVALINGSPKVNNSASKALLEDLKCYFSEKAEIVEFGFHKTSISGEILEELGKVDAWVLAFPLYVDGIPAHLLSCLIQLQQASLQNQNIHIYGIVNCGFYEGIQAEPALRILQNWCTKTGTIWGAGMGIGGGGALPMMPKMKLGQGPKAPIEKAMSMLADKMLRGEAHENMYVSVALPRFMYKMGAQFGWRQAIKANGGKKRDLGRRLE